MPRHILLLVLGFCCIAQLSTADAVQIGILAKDGPARCLEVWGETAEYLKAKVPGRDFVIVPLAFDAVNTALEKGEVAFALVNPGLSLAARDRFGAEPIATLVGLRDGKAAASYGGVILTRADHPAIKALADLKGRSFQAVKKTSFGGWLAGWKELADNGIDPAKDIARLEFVDKHENVVLNVLNGKADAGTVRTDTLERMAGRGDIDLAEIRVLAAKNHAGFPFLCSTPLYPEWPLLRLKATDAGLAAAVAKALQAMTREDKAAMAAQVAGWGPPADYAPVAALLSTLGVAAGAE